MANIDQIAGNARTNPELREWLIGNYSGFILGCAARCAGRALDKSDDEWSIALSAFSEAIDGYDPEKGSFLSHARLVINRRLIDQKRAAGRRRELLYPPERFAEEDGGEIRYEAVALEPGGNESELREELLNANCVLRDYGFSFFDLAGRTPQKKKPRGECAGAVNCLIDESPLFVWLREKRRLPLKRLAERSRARQKTLSFFRYFIITGAEILTRDFPSLRRYFLFIREERQK